MSDERKRLPGDFPIPEVPQLDDQEADKLFVDIRQQIAEESGLSAAVRTLPWRLQSLVAWLLALMVPSLFGFARTRPDLSLYPLWRMILEIGAMVSFISIAVPFALRPLWQRPLPHYTVPISWTAATGAMIVLAVLPEAHGVHPSSMAGVGMEFWRQAFSCLVTALFLGLPLIITILVMQRRKILSYSTATFAFIGAAMVGNLGLQLHCPITDRWHLLSGHAAAIIVLMLVFWLMRKRLV